MACYLQDRVMVPTCRERPKGSLRAYECETVEWLAQQDTVRCTLLGSQPQTRRGNRHNAEVELWQ